MNISDAGLAFIVDFEGTRNRPYDDGGPGVGNCTVGTGHVLAFRPCTTAELAQTYTDEQVMVFLREDVAKFESFVNSHATIALNQNQFDSLVDFSFNTGGGYPRVWDAVNGGGDVAGVLEVTAVLPQWAHEALVRRRKAEGALYNTPYAGSGEDMKRFNGRSAYFHNRPLGTGDYLVNADIDFPGIPAGVTRIRIEPVLAAGAGGLTVRDADGSWAGPVLPPTRSAQIDVFIAPINEAPLNGARGFRLRVTGAALTLDDLGIVGYF